VGWLMPNHCSNALTVTGPSSDLATFCNYALQKDEDIGISSCPDLHYLYPIPTTVEKDEDLSILAESEYKWRTDNWDTKWNTYSDEGLAVLRSETSNHLIGILCRFETAWSPPTGAIRVGSTRFPTLTFTLEYAEPGMFFKGVNVMKDGEDIVEHTEFECSDEEWESDTYLRMEDEAALAHIKSIREEFTDDRLKYEIPGYMF
jgi:hypothetical protein